MKILSFVILLSYIFSDYSGGYPGSSFRYGASAREVSLSNSIVSNNNKGFNAFTNPALLPKNRGRHIGSSLFILSADRNVQAFTFSQELPPSAVAAISLFRSGVNSIGINSNEEFTGNIGYSDGFIMLSFGVGITESISIGVNGKALFQKFSISTLETDNYTSTGIGADLGLLYSSGSINSGLKIEFGKFNFNEVIQGMNSQYEEKIPSRVSLGFSYSGINSILLLFQHELSKVNEDITTQRTSAGFEYQKNFIVPFHFRLGLRQAQWVRISDSNSIKVKPSIGLGTELTFMKKHSIKLDYGVMFDVIGINNLLSTSIKF